MKMSIEFRSLALPAALAVGVFCAVPSALSCPPLPPLVTVTASDPSAAEIGPDPGTFTVTRTGGNQGLPLTVYYNIGGTASNGTDYQTLSGWVQIPAGTNTANVTVTPITDAEFEGSETVLLTLTDTAYYDLGTPSSATVTIQDAADTDSDGLPDTWEQGYFGNLGQGADGDPDGDGLTNLQEYVLGTNPTMAAVPDSNNLINLQVYSPLK